MPITINGSTGIAGIDGSAGTPALQGSDTNTGIAFGADVILASTGGTERWRTDASGRLLIGTTSSVSNLLEGALQVVGTSVDSYITVTRYSSNAGDPAGIILGRSKSTTKGTNTIVASGDFLGAISFSGANGMSFSQAATIGAEVDGTPGANDMPGRLVFSTTADGASSPTERMRIDSNGLLNLGTATAPSGIHEIRWQGANRCSFRNMDATAANCYGLLIQYQSAAPNGTTNEFLYCEDGPTGTQRASIRSNGGFVNFQANNVNLSDVNTKKDIAPADGTWECLKQWEIVNYRYKDQPDDANLNLGVIAQQVIESCPEVVTVFQEAKEAKEAVLNEDGNETEPAQEAQPERLGIKEQQMYWMAIKALQEAQLRIEILEAKVAALEVTP